MPEALVSSSRLGAKFVASTQDLFTSEQVVIRGRIVNRPNVMYVFDLYACTINESTLCKCTDYLSMLASSYMSFCLFLHMCTRSRTSEIKI